MNHSSLIYKGEKQERKIYAVNVRGYTAYSDAFASIEPEKPGAPERLWFISLMGTPAAVKAITATLVRMKKGETMNIIEMSRNGDLLKPVQYIRDPGSGEWNSDTVKLPLSHSVHTLAYTTMAQADAVHERFMIIAKDRENPLLGTPETYYRFISNRVNVPIHPDWQQWLWDMGIAEGQITPMMGEGIAAWQCNANPQEIRERISMEVAMGNLKVAVKEL